MTSQLAPSSLMPLSRPAASQNPEISWTALDRERVGQRFETDLERGLSEAEAAERLARHGRNELAAEAGTPLLVRLLRQFSDVTVLALLAAAVLAAVIGILERSERGPLERFGDAIAIAIIVILNATIGFLQEGKAERALKALRELGAPEASVVRDGTLRRLSATEIVPGDLITLSEGSRIPADLRLVELTDLMVSEAALTGESTGVEKDTSDALGADTPLAERRNMAFAGTHVVRGTAHGVVVATGMQTELGRIASMLRGVQTPETPLQASLRRFGMLVVAACVLVGAIVFGVGLWRIEASWSFLLLTAVSLAVAAIPEGLPAITTIVLALGVQRMAKRNALIRRLAAVETLGSADVICTDKTGTLTENRMTVRRVYAGGVSAEVDADDDEPCLREIGSESRILPQELNPALDALVLSSRFVPADANPTDMAIAALHRTLSAGAPSSGMPVPEVLRTLPFDSQRKMATQLVSLPAGVVGIAHGAAERVLAQAKRVLDERGSERPLDVEARERLSGVIDAWAAAGLRVLGLARSEAITVEPGSVQALGRDALIERFERDLVLLGFVGMADPPRAGVDQAILRARSAGVATIMVTGDHPLTARSIAQEIGLLDQPGEVVEGHQLDKLGRTEHGARSEKIRVVARATPESKLRLVEALRAGGHVVAMTGDGVNDAPAIKAASIGIAMGRSGTDVAREAADMVLFDDNYTTIVSAIEEGRVIYGNIKRFILFLFSVNAGLVASVFVAAVLGWPPILTPTQILWINLITNGLPALALGMEPVHTDPMREKPRDPKAPLVDRGELVWLCLYGALMAALGLSTFASYQASAGGPLEGELLERARTATFTVLAIGPLFHALNCRSRDQSLLSLGIGSNWRLLGAFGAALVLQAIAVYVPPVERVFGTSPLPLREVLIALAVSASVWIVGEGEKLARRALRIPPVRR